MLAASAAPEANAAPAALPAAVNVAAAVVAPAVSPALLARLLAAPVAGPDKAFRPSVTSVFKPASIKVLPRADADACSACKTVSPFTRLLTKSLANVVAPVLIVVLIVDKTLFIRSAAASLEAMAAGMLSP
jgi:hypothetical protein